MASGCALVSTANGGVDDYAVHGENALLSPPKDSKSLTRNLLELLDDEALRSRIAQRGVEDIARFRWESSAERFETILSTIAEAA